LSGVATAFARKARQVLSDPTLRRWLLNRAFMRSAAIPPYRRTPEYLADLSVANASHATSGFGDLRDAAPRGPIKIELAGFHMNIEPGAAERIFECDFDDTESLIALHRFAWIDHAGARVDADWVAVIWRAWMQRFSTPDSSFAWHPYTAAERLINILRFAHVHGLPGPRDETLASLVRHGAAIFERLEYFGDDQTGNHLANNGRGLFLAGLALGRFDWTEIGERILLREAKRMFAPSGVLREGSSHYHALVTRWFDEVSAAAEAAQRTSASELRSIADKAGSVARHLDLPGGLPLIGDVSPDCPPDQLMSIVTGGSAPIDLQQLAVDGWLRMDCSHWHMLCHIAPDGWSPLPGHGHQDFGSFELHHGPTRVLCDFGRRSYDPIGDADVAAQAHNTLTIDGAEPYPRNKPYYDRAFRIRVAGMTPKTVRQDNLMELRAGGFARLRGVGEWRRTWRFHEAAVAIEDEISGSGRRSVVRHLHTTLPVQRIAGGVTIGDFQLTFDGAVELKPSLRWRSYGVSEPATSIDIVIEAKLPWSSTIKLSRR
jgi:hypothetical protein